MSAIRFVLLFLLVNAHATGIFSQCYRLRDSLVAVKLYKETKGDEWLKKNNWLSTMPLSSWYGIKTNPAGCITELNLATNKLVGPIPDSISLLSEMVRLNLADNRLTVSNSSDSIPAFGKMTLLEELNLSNNIFGGPVTRDLGTLQNLRILNLSLNYFTKNLPSSLGNLKNLRLLYLNQNELEGGIPPSFGQMTSLEELLISQNRLTSAIPAALGSSKNLKVLNLTQNQISGNIPAELGQIGTLRFVYLNENKLSGNIPASLGNLPELTELWLMDNQLSGNIPENLGQAKKLQKLLLNNNMLSGNIPPGLGDLADLVSLNLSDNKLTGPIPVSLGNLSKLLSLLMGNNMLEGAIPASFGNLTELRNLHLYNNKLTGNIPEEFGKMINLRRIYLQNNLLEGCFPENLRRFCPLKFSDNPNTTGYNFLGNTAMLFQGDFAKWCLEEYRTNAVFSDNGPLCEGNKLLLKAEEAQALTYVWSGPNGFTSIVRSPEIADFNALNAGIYSLTITDLNGCKASYSKEIGVVSGGQVSASSPACVGGKLQLGASGGLNYNWTGPEGFTSNLPNPAISNLVQNMSGIYTVEIKTADCTIIKQISVDVVQEQFATVENESPACFGKTITLKASGGVTYLWKNPGGTEIAGDALIITNLAPEKAGKYLVAVTRGDGCRQVLETEVIAVAPSKPDLDPISSVCRENGNLIIPNTQNGITGKWSGISGLAEIGDNFILNPAGKAGPVKLIFTPDPSFLCTDTASIRFMIHFNEISADESKPAVSEKDDDGIISFKVSGTSPSSEVTWTGPMTGRKNTTSGMNEFLTNMPSGIYVFSAIDANGCISKDTVTLRNLRATYFIPNAIRKNPENEENAFFFIQGDNILSYDLTIYDRWGNVHFSGQKLAANEISSGWNLSSSKVLPGVYVAQILLKLPLETKSILSHLTVTD